MIRRWQILSFVAVLLWFAAGLSAAEVSPPPECNPLRECWV
jgi:hypothetical protein